MKANQVNTELMIIRDLLTEGKRDKAFARAVKAGKKWPKVAPFLRAAGIAAAETGRPKVART